MKKILTFTYLTILLIGCSSKFDGRIENRAGQSYLVNTSTSQSFRFTIKKIEIKDDTTYSYSTDLISLSPGDEKLLGNNLFDQIETIETGEDKSIQVFTPTNRQLAQKKDLEKRRNVAEKKGDDDALFAIAFDESIKNEHDTIVDGKPMLYRYVYSKRPPITKTHKFQISFEITGQIKIKQ